MPDGMHELGPALPNRPLEQPMPDWAPFAVQDEEIWRNLQRRRHLIQSVEQLANLALNEGFVACHTLLSNTADDLRHLLLKAALAHPKPQAAQKPSRSRVRSA